MNNNNSNNNVIVRNSFRQHKKMKLDLIESNGKAIAFKTINNPVPKPYKIVRNTNNSDAFLLEHHHIQKQSHKFNIVDNNEISYVNGYTDYKRKMHNIIQTEDQVQLFNNNGYSLLNEYRNILSPSPRGSDSGIESDCTDGNLSWLLNYKIHELPPVPGIALSDAVVADTSFCNSEILPKNMLSDLTKLKNGILLKEGVNVRACNSSPCRYTGPKKPPFTYTELIEYALSEKGELTVSGIYQWISDHFQFYKQNDDRWKNSVRHNLSINPHFRKGSKAVHGAGHLWTIAQRDDKKSFQIKQRVQHFIQASQKDSVNHHCSEHNKSTFDMELQAATASILGETFDQYDKQATDDLEKNQKIEVEFINVIDINNDGLEDFLSPPVSKQEIVQECGLGNDFLITDINPTSLGFNVTEGEVVTDGTFYDDIAFEYYEFEKNESGN